MKIIPLALSRVSSKFSKLSPPLCTFGLDGRWPGSKRRYPNATLSRKAMIMSTCSRVHPHTRCTSSDRNVAAGAMHALWGPGCYVSALKTRGYPALAPPSPSNPWLLHHTLTKMPTTIQPEKVGESTHRAPGPTRILVVGGWTPVCEAPCDNGMVALPLSISNGI